MSLLLNIEGIDGSGKTTVQEAIEKWYYDNDVLLVLSNEPGGSSPIAKRIREVILDHYPNDVFHPLTEALLYNASRHQNYKNIILPALDAGIDVLTSRFSDSTLAYQGYGRGVDLSIIDVLESFCTYRHKPNMTFLLDIEPTIGLARVKATRGVDRLESSPIDFFERCREGFLLAAKHNAHIYTVIDASQPKEVVIAQVISRLEELKGIK